MASKINYNTKAPFQTREDIPDENKVNAEDMNEIKTAVNNNADELDTAKEDIESLQNGQGTASTDITSLKNRTTALETDNTTNKQNIQNLQTDNETNKTNITDLQNDKVDKIEGKELSTEDFTTELKTKLEGLENYNDTEIKADIEELANELEEKVSTLEESQEKQDAEIGILMNALPSETQEGENINIKGTIPVKFKEFKVSGNSKQETREGYNLLNVEDNFEVTGRANPIQILLKANTTYTIKVDNIETTNENPTTFAVSFRDEEDVAIRDITVSFTSKKTTFSVPQETAKVYIYSGSNWNNSQEITTIFTNLMIYKGTEEKPYEPYGVSPSPDYPSEIQNVEGDVNVTVCNKNIMKVNTEYYELTENGIKTTVNSVGKRIAEFTIKKGQIVKFGFKLLSKPTTSSTFTIYVNNIETTNLSFTRFQDFNVKQTYETTYTATEDVKIKIILWGNSNNEIFEFQLWTELDSLTDYVTHQEQTVTFPLSEGQKLMKGDYLAEDGIHHAKKQIELDGTENVLTPTNLGNVTRFLIYMKIEAGSYVNKEGQLSSHFKYLRNFTQDSEHFYIENDAGSIYLFTNSRTANDVNSLKAFLSTQKQAGTPVVVEYKLAEEEIEAYTEAQQEAYNQLLKLKSYEGSTNIYSINETSPIFKVTAVKDINSVITQLNQLILEGGN